jgi:hypothetical protein
MTGFIVSVFPFRNRVSPKEAFEGLELGEGKPSRPVLRGPGGRKAAWLLGSYPRRPLVGNRLNWRKIASLTTPLPVKYFFSTLPPALMTERHFALAENVAHQLNMARPTKARS